MKADISHAILRSCSRNSSARSFVLSRARSAAAGASRSAAIHVRPAHMCSMEQGRILLLEHEFRPDSRWGIPGGFLDNREHRGAMRRELREEVALEVDDSVFSLRALWHGRVRLKSTLHALPMQPDSEQLKSGGRLFDPGELPADLSRDQRRMIKRAIDVREKRRG